MPEGLNPRTISTGEDERGPFAVLAACTILGPDGIRIVVEPEYLPDLLPGGCITIEQVGRSRAVTHQVAQQQGYDPNLAHILAPPEWSLSVYFDSDGNLNGHCRLAGPPSKN